jgi:S1-C subfamily serine protease
MRPMAILLLTASVAVAAPLPREPLPDPIGRGYVGIYFGQGPLSVGQVIPGTPAEKVGMKPGDVFVRVGTFEPKDRAQLQQFLSSIRPGTPMLVTVRRGEETKSMIVRLAARPADSEPYIPPTPIDPP